MNDDGTDNEVQFDDEDPGSARGVDELRERIATEAAPNDRTSHASEEETPASIRGTEGGSPSKFWTRTKLIVSAGITVLGATTGVISALPILTADPSNFSHLQMHAQAEESPASEWAIDAAAFAEQKAEVELIEVFSGKAPCGPEEQAWLAEHAVPLNREFTLTVRNVAKEGPMLALTDFRSTSNGSGERGEISVRLLCDPTGVVPQSLTFAKLVADDSSETAAVSRFQTDAPRGIAPVVPLVFNLAPGESGSIPLHLFSRMPAEGTIAVTVLSGEEAKTVEIDNSSFSLPAMLFAGEMYLFTGEDGLMCQRTDRGSLETCTIDELIGEWSDATSRVVGSEGSDV